MPEWKYTAKKISGFRFVKEGWHYGEGVPPLPEVVDKAMGFNEILGTAEALTDAFLGSDGAIQVSGYHPVAYLEFIVEADGVVTLHVEKPDRGLDDNDGL